MELQELVERIERWKSRMSIEAEGESEPSGIAEEASAFGETVSEDAIVDANDLDFEEMELSEIPNGDSGIVEAEVIEEEVGNDDDEEVSVSVDDDLNFDEIIDDEDDFKENI
jgi:L-lactate utilization protein LutC